MDTAMFLPAFLLLIPILLAVVDLMGIGGSHSSMGALGETDSPMVR